MFIYCLFIVYLIEKIFYNLILFLYSRGRIMAKLLKVNIQKELKEFDLDVDFELKKGCLGILGPSGLFRYFRSFRLWKKYDIEIHCRYCKS